MSYKCKTLISQILSKLPLLGSGATDGGALAVQPWADLVLCRCVHVPTGHSSWAPHVPCLLGSLVLWPQQIGGTLDTR